MKGSEIPDRCVHSREPHPRLVITGSSCDEAMEPASVLLRSARNDDIDATVRRNSFLCLGHSAARSGARTLQRARDTGVATSQWRIRGCPARRPVTSACRSAPV